MKGSIYVQINCTQYMKNRFHYMLWLVGLVSLLTACEKIEPELFHKGSDGAYFDYSSASDYERTLNFSDHIVGNPDTVTVALRVKLLGYLMDKERTLAVKTKEIAGYEPADVLIDRVVFSNKEYEKDIEVKVRRPQVEDSVYAICIYLDGSGDLGTGIKGKEEVNLYVTESYAKPSVWYSHMETYLGAWSKEKHIYLANHTGNDHFNSALYDNEMGIHLFDSIVALNVSAVNALLSEEPEAESVLVDLPILKETDYPAYREPYFWSGYEDLLGVFRAGKFCRFVMMLGGATTADVADLFASDEAAQSMAAEAAGLHKDDVLYMLNEYYSYARLGYGIQQLKELFWVEMRSSVNYNVRIPYWWEDPDMLGTAEIVKKYFGEYENGKYQFMLKTMLKEDGAGEFITASLLPFVYDKANGTYAWDGTPLGTKQLSGEQRLKECYRIIKAANDKRPTTIRYDIPEVELD